MKIFIANFLITCILLTIFGFTMEKSLHRRGTEPPLVVELPNQGKILGNYEKTLWTQKSYMQFLGIPYAESPSEELRFKPPVERSPWNNTFVATQYGRRCPVITSLNLTNTEVHEDLEDCLNLCVFTKKLNDNKPVMFYIYGGGFYNGSNSDHPPKYLLEKDIVLVVPNYRVGALGWLSTYTSDMPGNVAIMDIILALEWVQKYISSFGGDPNEVTIVGQSAGAAISSILLLSPVTGERFFKRAIIQSGSAFANWAMTENPEAQARRICEDLNCESCNTNQKIYNCVKAATVTDLLVVTKEDSFSPILRDLNGILPEHLSVLITTYNKKIPVMTGFTKDDGSFVLATYYDAMKAAYQNLSSLTVRQFANGIMDMVNDTSLLTNNVLTRLLFERSLLNSNDHKKAIPSYFDLTSILFMKSPVIALASKLAEKHLAPTYLYTFYYEGEHTRFGYEFGNDHYPFNGGVHHSNDNIYVFNTHDLNENDTYMAKQMVRIWTSFITKGIPRCRGPHIRPMEDENGPYFRIDQNITLGDDILQELTATFDDPDNEKLNRKDIEF